jgi:hypothetical protein
MANNVLYKHTARLPQAGPEAAAFHEGENSVSETKEITRSVMASRRRADAFRQS